MSNPIQREEVIHSKQLAFTMKTIVNPQIPNLKEEENGC
jgi:hypothetical protein